MIKSVLVLFFTFFLFSGCVGQEKVQKDAKCFQKGKTGNCRGYFIKYHYNEEKNSCENYVWGGCGDVVFDSLDECKSKCEE